MRLKVQKAKPSNANMVWLVRKLKGKWSFDIRDVCRWLKCSERTAQRYVVKMQEAEVLERMLFLKNRYFQYRIRRDL
jgi:hypothetical protein